MKIAMSSASTTSEGSSAGRRGLAAGASTGGIVAPGSNTGGTEADSSASSGATAPPSTGAGAGAGTTPPAASCSMRTVWANEVGGSGTTVGAMASGVASSVSRQACALSSM